MPRKLKRGPKSKQQRLKEVLKVYEDPASTGSYGSRTRLQKTAVGRPIGKTSRVNNKDVDEFLKQSESYTLHHQRRIHFPRQKTIVSAIDQQWQADLADMIKVASENDGYRYLLTVIDCFSKFAWVVPVLKKDAKTMLEAFKQLFTKSHPRKPQLLQTDKGLEFYNKPVKDYLIEQNVKLFSSNSDMKAAMVERFNRTLKHRIYEYFTAKKTTRYIDKLDAFVKSYNHSNHRTIGMAPADVKKDHEERLFARMYGEYFTQVGGPKRKRSDDIKVGDTVRISRIKRDFEKGYTFNWSEEQFTITSVIPKPGHNVYQIKDMNGEVIQGHFYRYELLPVTVKKV